MSGASLGVVLILEMMAEVSSANDIVLAGLLGFLACVLMFIVWWRKYHRAIAGGVDSFVWGVVPAEAFLVIGQALAIVFFWLVVRYMDELTGMLVGWLR